MFYMNDCLIKILLLLLLFKETFYTRLINFSNIFNFHSMSTKFYAFLILQVKKKVWNRILAVIDFENCFHLNESNQNKFCLFVF